MNYKETAGAGVFIVLTLIPFRLSPHHGPTLPPVEFTLFVSPDPKSHPVIFGAFPVYAPLRSICLWKPPFSYELDVDTCCFSSPNQLVPPLRRSWPPSPVEHWSVLVNSFISVLNGISRPRSLGDPVSQLLANAASKTLSERVNVSSPASQALTLQRSYKL